MQQHREASGSESEAVVKALLAAYPDAAKEKNGFRGGSGRMPLHAAAEFNTTEAVVKVLLDAYPDAAKAKDEFPHGFLPLHWASVKIDASEAVIKLLLAAYPDAANEKDERGRLPRELARSDGANRAWSWWYQR